MEHAPAVVPSRAVRRPASLLRLAADDRLVALVRDGDERAFEVLYDRHHRPILSFCRHMLGSYEEAEDAVQHTFLAAYRDLLASAKPIQLRPWLFTIARNRCLSLLRARREHVALALAEPATEGLAATVERREDVRELLGDLARLPEDQRAALLLSELGALDHAGIATVLGCRREKVKALVFQARASLAASRDARATSCEQIRAQLAVASGGALRRSVLRRHVRDCADCRAFRAEVGRQRALLAVALPVLPSAGLKLGALGGIVGGAGSATLAGGAATGGVLSVLGSVGVTKFAISLAVTGALAGGGALTLDAVQRGANPARPSPPASTHAPDSGSLVRSLLPIPTTIEQWTVRGGAGAATPPIAGSTPPRSSTPRGFAPRRAAGRGGNGAAARGFGHSRPGRAAPAPLGLRSAPGQGRARHGRHPAPGAPAKRVHAPDGTRGGAAPGSDQRPPTRGATTKPGS